MIRLQDPAHRTRVALAPGQVSPPNLVKRQTEEGLHGGDRRPRQTGHPDHDLRRQEELVTAYLRFERHQSPKGADGEEERREPVLAALPVSKVVSEEGLAVDEYELGILPPEELRERRHDDLVFHADVEVLHDALKFRFDSVAVPLY